MAASTHLFSWDLLPATPPHGMGFPALREPLTEAPSWSRPARSPSGTAAESLALSAGCSQLCEQNTMSINTGMFFYATKSQPVLSTTATET